MREYPFKISGNIIFKFLKSCILIGWEHMATPKPYHTQCKQYYQKFPFINLSKHTKNQANSSIRSWDKANLKILNSDWPTAFLPLSQALEFSQAWNFHRDVANDERLHFRPFPGKNNDRIFKNPWKTLFLGHFGPILPIFGPLNFFFKNPALLRTTSHWSLPTYQFSKKSNGRIPRNCPDRRKDGQDWFYRTLRPSAGGPKSCIWKWLFWLNLWRNVWKKFYL